MVFVVDVQWMASCPFECLCGIRCPQLFSTAPRRRSSDEVCHAETCLAITREGGEEEEKGREEGEGEGGGSKERGGRRQEVDGGR